jgi:hypothetical protein
MVKLDAILPIELAKERDGWAERALRGKNFALLCALDLCLRSLDRDV